MKKALFASLLFFLAIPAYAGSIQFNTYYPSPIGAYDRLRLVPRDPTGMTCDGTTAGTFFVSNVDDAIYYCDGTSYSPFAGGGGYWDRDTTYDYLYPTTITDWVGIGTATPTSMLEVNGSIRDTGNFSFYPLANSGALMWNSYNDGTGDKYLTNDSAFEIYHDFTSDTLRLSGKSGGAADSLVGFTEDYFVVTTTGEIGIGTVTPTAKLDVDGGDALINGVTAGIGGGNVSWNTAFGSSALKNNTSGYYNTATGYQALWSNTTGIGNTAFGEWALKANTTASSNTAIGNQALLNNTGAASGGTAVGSSALQNNTTGASNTAIGNGAMFNNSIGDRNTAVGSGALFANDTGTTNAVLGQASLNSNVSGSNNTVVGAEAGHSALGSGNVFLGFRAGYSETGSDKLYIANSWTDPPLIYGDFSNGNIGVGTTTPTQKLEVVGGAIKATGGLIIETRTDDPATPVDGQMWLRTDL